MDQDKIQQLEDLLADLKTGTPHDTLQADGFAIALNEAIQLAKATATLETSVCELGTIESPARVCIDTIDVQHGATVVFGEYFEPAWTDQDEAAYGEAAFGNARRRPSPFMRRMAERLAEAELANVLAAGGGFDVDSIIDAIVNRLEDRWQDRPLLVVLLAFVRSDLFKALIASLITPAT